MPSFIAVGDIVGPLLFSIPFLSLVVFFITLHRRRVSVLFAVIWCFVSLRDRRFAPLIGTYSQFRNQSFSPLSALSRRLHNTSIHCCHATASVRQLPFPRGQWLLRLLGGWLLRWMAVYIPVLIAMSPLVARILCPRCLFFISSIDTHRAGPRSTLFSFCCAFIGSVALHWACCFATIRWDSYGRCSLHLLSLVVAHLALGFPSVILLYLMN